MEPHLRLSRDAVNHLRAGRVADAETATRAALTREPADAPLLDLLGSILGARGRMGEAEFPLLHAARVDPTRAETFAKLGAVALRSRRPETAEARSRHALALDPGAGDAAECLGAAFHALADYARAAAWSLRAHALDPARAEPLINLGAALRDSRRPAAAETCFLAAIDRDPSSREAKLALAVTRLAEGDLKGGFEAFEARWKRLSTPQWDGRPTGGGRLLIHAEQGFGDIIQFLRFVPRAIEVAGGPVTVEVPTAILRLVRLSLPGVEVVERPDGVTPHDLQIPMMSLPLALDLRIETIAGEIPYLRVDPADVERLRFPDDRPNVGLVWAGNASHVNDRNRSVPFRALAPILEVEGIRLVALQTGPARRDGLRVPGIVDAMERIVDFADTAATLLNLDLVITVDTAVAHLAGALGRPAWMLLPFAPDWRWGWNRAESPWYPKNPRLFRQPRPCDWKTPIATIAAGLRRLAAR